ncbi:apolipoprotein N-acyltransferase [Caulobacter sp. UNC279MFTsu5.1]|uniref:apolipoprotein N-acyltransferase n=1 Tax=Caulobacter sp. UNC279MFTsu5.1 TaxID=1502775 RepID=UPI000368FA9B|nr:apolipoprotein N-acyltransferase [Caulobacter sp. UNC279MFTsu5.1]SFK08707.1 apolipoprotein N-acyltransferase [Caulobacter sp. UNC279MFTsu5.1]
MNLPPLPKLTPWRVRGLALLAGLAAALAHPPFGILPGLLGYAVLLWLLDAVDGPRPLRSAFFRGWLTGLSYFGLSTWWIAEAFMVDAANQGWMAPFAVAAMAAGMALFWGLAAVLYRLIRPPGARRVLVFAGAFAALEWTRGHILTGFPWNLPGETWRAGSAPSQVAALVGAYGLTWITLALAAAPAVWRDGRRGRIAVGAALAGLVGLFVGGALLPTSPTAPAGGQARTSVRIVQADIPQESKWDAGRFAQIVQAYVSLTARPYAGKPADIVVWPEGALPLAINDYMVQGSWVRQAIIDALRPGQLMLLGGYRYEGTPDQPVYYNSLVALRRTANDVEVVGIYDKHRLVPFGEYLPADALMTRLGVKSMAHLGDGFATGPAPRPMRIAPNLLVQPLICYESLFPRLAEPAPGVRAIVNVSNDAWFGVTSGPLQHLNLASYRAIETGLPLIRATPTGVSALIDAQGRILPGARLKLGESGVIDGNVPNVGSPTLFSRLGHWPFGLLLLVSFALAIRVPGGRGLEKVPN